MDDGGLNLWVECGNLYLWDFLPPSAYVQVCGAACPDVQGEFAMIIFIVVPKFNSLKSRNLMMIKPHSFHISAVSGGLTPLIQETNLITLRIGKRVDSVTFLEEFTKTETSDYRWDFHPFGLSLAFPFPHKAVTTKLKGIMIMMVIVMMMMMIIILIVM